MKALRHPRNYGSLPVVHDNLKPKSTYVLHHNGWMPVMRMVEVESIHPPSMYADDDEPVISELTEE